MSLTDRRYLKRGLLFWPALAVLAVVNGVARGVALAPLAGPEAALPLSGLTLMSLFIAASGLFARHAGATGSRAAPWLLGVLWVALAVAFEAAMAVLVMGAPLSALGQVFDPAAVKQGNLLLPVLFVTACLPALWDRLLHRGPLKLP